MPQLESLFPQRNARTVRECDLLVVDAEFPDLYFLDDIAAQYPLPWRYRDEGDRVFSRDYVDLLSRCLKSGARQHNQRTGTGVRTLLHQRLSHECMFGLPLAGARKLHPKTAAAELAWSLMGTEEVAFMARHAPIWDKFAVAGRVPGAYGYRWRRAFGRDQLRAAVDTLVRDPSSRQVYVSTWDPAGDGLNADSRALAPCPVGFTFQVVDGFLSAFVHLRSSDLAVGLPYDVMVYALLLDAVAAETGYGRGALTLSLDHAHIYEHQARALESCSHAQQTSGCVPMPRWTLSAIEADPDGYVARVKALGADVRQPPALPLEAVGAAA